MFRENMKKQMKKILVAGLLCLSTPALSFAADYLSITVDNANVRTAPSTDSQVSMELFAGYPLKVLKKQGDWYQVIDFENDSGWVHESIVKKADTVIVNSNSSVNMRSGPSTKSAVVADVERGVVLKKLSEKSNWVEVQHASGTKGWIYAPLLWP